MTFCKRYDIVAKGASSFLRGFALLRCTHRSWGRCLSASLDFLPSSCSDHRSRLPGLSERHLPAWMWESLGVEISPKQSNLPSLCQSCRQLRNPSEGAERALGLESEEMWSRLALRLTRSLYSCSQALPALSPSWNETFRLSCLKFTAVLTFSEALIPIRGLCF